MKINIVVDMKGTVVGTFHPVHKLHGGIQIQAGVIPPFGHSIHQIDVDEKLMTQHAAKIHEEAQKIAIAQLGPEFHLKKN